MARTRLQPVFESPADINILQCVMSCMSCLAATPTGVSLAAMCVKTSAAIPGDRACCDELQHAVIATHSSGIALVCRQSALLQPRSQSLTGSWPASRRPHLQLCPCMCTQAVQAGRLLLLAVQSMLGRVPQFVTAESFGLYAAAQAAAALCRAQCTHARHRWLDDFASIVLTEAAVLCRFRLAIQSQMC